MYAIFNICFFAVYAFITLLPTTTVFCIASHLRRNKLWAWFWTVLAILGGLGIIALPPLFRQIVGPHPMGLEGLVFVPMLGIVLAQLIVIGIVALALRTTKHTAARREEVPPRRGFLWILWIIITEFLPVSALLLIAFFVLKSENPIIHLRWCMHVVCTPLLPLALAFIVAGHWWKAHVWATFWYLVAVPGAIGLVIRLFPSLVQSGSLLHGLKPGVYENWARIYPAIFVLAAVCCVVTLRLSLARSNSMWRWAFTWATLGYVLLMLVGWNFGSWDNFWRGY